MHRSESRDHDSATSKVAALLSMAAAGVVLVGAMLPWQHVSKCVFQCAFPFRSNWNVLQVGGSWLPSGYTASGILVLLGAGLIALAGLSALGAPLGPWIAARTMWVNVLGAGLVAVGAFTVPTPSYPSTPPLYFSAAQGIGPWVTLLGALLGLLGSALFARNGLLHERAPSPDRAMVPVAAPTPG